MMGATVLVGREGAVARLTLNRPEKRNALSAELVAELKAALRDADADEGIRVNAVAPGLVLTDLHETNGQPDRPLRMAPSIPIRRAGMPDEIAAAILWLLSDEASYVTGSILEVGGGR